MSEMIKVNPLPAPTWRWLRINDTEIGVTDDADEALTEVELPGEISDSALLEAEDVERLLSAESGMGTEFANWIAGCPVEPVTITATVGVRPERPAVFRIFGTEGELTAGRYQVVARKDSEMTVVMYMVPEATVAVETRLLIEDGAKVHLVQVCDSAETATAYCDVAAVLGKESEFSLLQITLGRKEACFGVAADLRGDRSRLEIDTAYIAGQNQKVDINYVARHRGVDTESEIKVNGVLRAGSTKAFRGTIDFIRGCSGSKGDEREDVLLLDEDIVNQTIPLILCQEENVEGTHGATIGDLSEETLLYFRSRGIPDEEAYRLLADGRMISAIREIPEQVIREKLLERFGETEGTDEDGE